MNRSRVFVGLFWSFVDRGGDQALRLLISIVLARKVLPEAFGLIAMVNVVFEIAQRIVDGGFGLALINKHNHDKKDECTVFYFNIIMAAACSFALLIVSPLIAAFYRRPELELILKVMSASFFVSSFSTIPTVLIMKKMDFKRQALINMGTTIASGSLAIGLALFGFGVWSLVIQLMARSIIVCILLWTFYPWRPSLVFDFGALRALWKYGSHMFASSAVTILFGNIYNIIIGRFYSADALAYFWRGNQLQQVPNSAIWATVGRVSFPAFSFLKNDRSKALYSFRKAFCLLSFSTIPMMLIAAACSRNLIVILYSEKWLSSVVYFKILCFSGAFVLLDNLINNAVAAGAGRSGIYLLMNVLQKCLLILSIVISFQYGIIFMTIAFSITMIICFLVDYILFCKVFAVRILSEISSIAPYVIFGIAAFSASSLIGHYIIVSAVGVLVLQCACGILTYAVLNAAFHTKGWIEARELLWPKVLSAIKYRKAP